MSKLLHIIASPRGANSQSNTLAAAYVDARRASEPDLQVDTLDLWHADLPEFDGDKAAAKMTFSVSARWTPHASLPGIRW